MRYYNQLTTELFIERAKEIHGDKYDYSKVNYINSKTKVCIICPEHGEFWQTPDGHMSGKGCPICRYIKSSKSNSLTTEEFVRRAKEIHGDKYDYSKVEYVNQKTPVCIICPEHGEFWQTPSGHIDKKADCPKCKKNHRYTTEEFVDTLPQWIKDKYDFSKFKYKTTHEKSILICKEHGEFLQSPHNIRKGIGCPECNESKLERNVREFLKENKIEYISEYKKDADFAKQRLDFFLPKYSVGIECQGIQHFVPTDFAGKGEEWKINEFKHIQELDINKQRMCFEKGIKLIYYTTKEHKILSEKNSSYDCYPVLTDVGEILNYL